MSRIAVVKLHWLFALLITAHLGGMAHAAEFGTGEHLHDGVACSFGLSSHDDHGLVRPAPVTEATVGIVETIPGLCISVDARADVLLPPSTGPPKTN